MKKKLLLLLLVIWAGKLLHDAGAPIPTQESGGPAQATLATGAAALARTWHGVGVYGSYLGAPVVENMQRRHTETIALLEPAIRKAPVARRKRTVGVIERIQELDSMAVERMARGYPVSALRYGMQAGGLVDAVRDNVREESLTW